MEVRQEARMAIVAFHIGWRIPYRPALVAVV
ncbi:hypothetical protein AFE_1724 [Acidithiobacillus ferrooxidans ATCC 23270]|uniref:Uncharacterized protein n=1 Tax=Acidithiobacillus ferrooxidans (strain ATCC 23270 / DSM 14882 / CIP 104768 / NCIMB 8455) TaxID=243159 RepID=B7JB61_ACIF2|nr:hypothetical protein AFE_1724 [Acidithiobacillus ferrooxidans ATCC 23270]